MAISRSENMRRIRSRDTGPELTVRRSLRQLGFTGYRLCRKDLPGKPDIVFIGRKKAIFVHGCFWHGHACHEGKRKPKTNQGYWIPKIQRNRERDQNNRRFLKKLGWKVMTVWECEIQNSSLLAARLKAFMVSGE